MEKLTADQRRLFRDQLRVARAVAFRDAESSSDIINAMEEIGAYLLGYRHSLGRCREAILDLAAQSPLAEKLPEQFPEFHIPSSVLYDYAHQGACARHLTAHAVELSMMLEDSLMNTDFRARDFMVPDPVVANPWEPLSLVRKKMLTNALASSGLQQGESPPGCCAQ